MRASHEIGDDAFHQFEDELDWLEIAGDALIHHADEAAETGQRWQRERVQVADDHRARRTRVSTPPEVPCRVAASGLRILAGSVGAGE